MSLYEQINKVLIEHRIEDRKEMITHQTKTQKLFLDKISKVNAKIDEVSNNMISFSETVTRMTNEVKDVHIIENKRLSNCLVMSKLEEQNYVTAIYQMREKILQFEEEGKSLEKFNALEKENTQMLEKVDQLETLQKSWEEKLDRFRSEIKAIEETKKTARNEILLLHKQVKERDKKIQSLEKDMIDLTEGKKKMTPYSDKKHMETQMLQEETKEKDDTTNVVVEYTRQITDLKESKIQMQKDIEKKEKEIRSLKKKIEKLTDEKEEAIKYFEIKQHLTAKRHVYVQVVHHPRFKAFESEKELQMQLKLKFIPENIELKFVCITSDFVRLSDSPVFVVYPRQFCSTRERDINNIVQFYKVSKMNKMTALVFFHDKDKKGFKKEEGGKGSHSGRTFCDVFDIINGRDGISYCDENSKNIEKMFEFITNACR
ncbi:tax1-binding protein 1 homolog [Ruditapes philippinarum]|uniref:tax1-binding protein 1 homolog n=1 Tax=Ruditapes philippinarum TaxID=129788 RepID=UPI00295BAC48|nr:tax1-binding protein 1 homolog [Ruditapes philippinarum]